MKTLMACCLVASATLSYAQFSSRRETAKMDSAANTIPLSHGFSAPAYQNNNGFGNASYQMGAEKRWIFKENISWATSSLPMSATEKELIDLEDRECRAILKSDMAILQRLWARDFTLDEPQGKVVMSKNPLPCYVSFSRMVEKFDVIDNTVYTGGHEQFSPLQNDSSIGRPIKRSYAHIWARRNCAWQLVSKITGEERTE